MICNAVILARGGSKRIPKKNIKMFLGKPLISYPIDTCVESNAFGNIIVSSDSMDIINAGLKFGANNFIKRENAFSNDMVSAFETAQESARILSGEYPDDSLLTIMYGTSIFVKPYMIKQSVEALREFNCEMVFAATKFNFPPQRGFRIIDERAVAINPEHFLSRSQDLEQLYHDVGQIYTASLKYWKSAKNIFSKNSKALLIPGSEVQDIDTLDDWKNAEIKYREML